MRTHRSAIVLAGLAGLLALIAGSVAAQDSRNERFYLPGAFNWAMLRNYPEAAPTLQRL